MCHIHHTPSNNNKENKEPELLESFVDSSESREATVIETGSDNPMSAEEALRWISSIFKMKEDTKDEAEELGNLVHIFAEAGANEIVALQKEVARLKNMIIEIDKERLDLKLQLAELTAESTKEE